MQINLGQHVYVRVSLNFFFLIDSHLCVDICVVYSKVHSSYLLLVHGKYSTIISMLHIYQFTFLFQLFKRREKLSHANGIYLKTNTCN